MNSNLNNLAVGFFVGICFMATVVVALTVLYFARPRPKTRTVKKSKKSVTKAQVSNDNKQPTAWIKRALYRIGHIFTKPEDFIRKLILPVMAKLLVYIFKTKTKATSGKKESENQKKAKKETRYKKNSSEANPIQPEPNPASDTVPVQEKPMKPESPAPIIIAEAPRPQVESTTLEPQVQKMLESEIKRSNDAAQEMNPVANPIADEKPVLISVNHMPQIQEEPAYSTPREAANTQTIENTIMESKEVKPKEDESNARSTQNVNDKNSHTESESKSQPSNPSNDFSDLFTEEDFEDNEVTKLAKELNDLDSQVILEESMNLVSQFKRNKN